MEELELLRTAPQETSKRLLHLGLAKMGMDTILREPKVAQFFRWNNKTNLQMTGFLGTLPGFLMWMVLGAAIAGEDNPLKIFAIAGILWTLYIVILFAWGTIPDAIIRLYERRKQAWERQYVPVLANLSEVEKRRALLGYYRYVLNLWGKEALGAESPVTKLKNRIEDVKRRADASLKRIMTQIGEAAGDEGRLEALGEARRKQEGNLEHAGRILDELAKRTRLVEDRRVRWLELFGVLDPDAETQALVDEADEIAFELELLAGEAEQEGEHLMHTFNTQVLPAMAAATQDVSRLTDARVSIDDSAEVMVQLAEASHLISAADFFDHLLPDPELAFSELGDGNDEVKRTVGRSRVRA